MKDEGGGSRIHLTPEIIKCLKVKLQATHKSERPSYPRHFADIFTLPSGKQFQFIHNTYRGDFNIQAIGSYNEADEEILDEAMVAIEDCTGKVRIRDLKKAVAERQKRDVVKGLSETRLPEDITRKIADYAATGKVEGGKRRKTRKVKKTTKKTRKFKGRR